MGISLIKAIFFFLGRGGEFFRDTLNSLVSRHPLPYMQDKVVANGRWYFPTLTFMRSYPHLPVEEVVYGKNQENVVKLN